MNIHYSTTQPRWSDTRAITKGKWLQVEREGSSDGGESQLMIYPDTLPRFHDSKKITLDKILQESNAQDFDLDSSSGTTGLQAYWKLDSAGATWADSGPNGYTLTRTGTVNAVAGKIGNGANFTNSSANYLSNANLIVPVNVPWSVQAWVKMNSIAADSKLFGNGVVGALDGWRMFFSGASKTFALSSYNSDATAEERVVSSVSITAGGFHHIVATVDAAQDARIFVDGFMDFDQHQFFTDPGQPFRIGNDNDLAFFPANAVIDEVALWAGKVLTLQEILYLYNGGNGRTIL